VPPSHTWRSPRGHRCSVAPDVNRKSWPHGDFGNAEPNSMLFVVARGDVG
jgi:hypothetical protein